MYKIYYLAIWIVVFSLSFIEFSGFIDTHHDFLMLLGGVLVENGNIPYIDYYEQYGVFQPLLLAFLFKIFGHEMAVQSLLFALVYATVVTNIGLLVKYLTRDDKLGVLAALVFFGLEPYAQFPWPNYLLALLTSYSLILFFQYIDSYNKNKLLLSLFICALTPYVRSNAGLMLPLIYAIGVFVYFINVKDYKNLVLAAFMVSPVFVASVLFMLPDYYIQSIRLPKEILLPFFFKLPSEMGALIRLHYELFFQNNTLSSIVTPTPILYVWRYILVIGLCGSLVFIFYNYIFKKDRKFLQILALLVFGVLESSTVFPIFDGFRAACAWYPFFIVVICVLHQLNFGRLIYLGMFVFFVWLSIVNIKSNQSIYELVSRYKISYAYLQFVDFTKHEEIKKYETEFMSDGSTPSNTKKFTMSNTSHNLSYDIFYDAISENCNNKYFLSYLPNFYLYFLKDDFAQNLAHKMYMSIFVKKAPGEDWLDTYSVLYPDYYEVINSRKGLCMLLPDDVPNEFIKKIGLVNKVVNLPNSYLYVR